MAETLTKFAYQTLQQGKAALSLAHKRLSGQLLRDVAIPLGIVAVPEQSESTQLSEEQLKKIRDRYDQVLKADWQDAEAGIYPTELLFDNPWGDILKFYPLVWLDLPQIWYRAGRKYFKDFSPAIDTTGYPNYYVQNFHHQTDGYLSDLSAHLYDIQVEILFNGAADAMRRRILAPLKQHLTAQGIADRRTTQVLDVACGTGRTLRLLRSTFPKVALHGLDLSPHYVRKASELLADLPGELPQLTQANAEEMPYRDRYFDAVTCVFLFHELPAPVRQNVIDQVFQVTKPGGIFVICDSIQLSDSPDMERAMEGFAKTFHEPFYRDYMRDDLVARLQTAGFTHIQEEQHFMSKYLIAYKPD
ncbi:MAG: class I SAM-dependent methyltransferase [Synechococcales bacterium]|nr:class I SAM-dependent methyltransferase [Synechococcales bacterium]